MKCYLEPFCLFFLTVFHENQCIGQFFFISKPLFSYIPHSSVLYKSVKLLSILSVSSCYNWILTSFADQGPSMWQIYEVLKIKSIETVIFWNVTHCSFIPNYWHFRGTSPSICSIREGSRFLSNIGTHLFTTLLMSHSSRWKTLDSSSLPLQDPHLFSPDIFLSSMVK